MKKKSIILLIAIIVIFMFAIVDYAEFNIDSSNIENEIGLKCGSEKPTILYQDIQNGYYYVLTTYDDKILFFEFEISKIFPWRYRFSSKSEGIQCKFNVQRITKGSNKYHYIIFADNKYIRAQKYQCKIGNDTYIEEISEDYVVKVYDGTYYGELDFQLKVYTESGEVLDIE